MQALLINHALLRRRGYEVHNNTPEQIRAAVSYKIDSLSGKSPRVGEDHPLMRRYRNALSQNPYMFGAAKPALPFLEAHSESSRGRRKSRWRAAKRRLSEAQSGLTALSGSSRSVPVPGDWRQSLIRPARSCS